MPDHPSSLPLRLAAAALLAAALAPAARAAAPSWPQPAYDAARSSYNAGEKTLKPANVGGLLRVASGQLGFNATGQSVQGGGLVFACSDKYGLSATSQASRRFAWSGASIGGTCNVPVLGSGAGTLYATAWRLSGSQFVNTLSALDAASGGVRWQVLGPPDRALPDASWLTFNNPTFSGDAVYVSSGRSLVSSYDAATGALRWRAETNFLNNEVAVADGLVFTSTWNQEGGPQNLLFAHHASDGTLAWSQPLDASNAEYPAIAAGGRVFAASDSGAVRAFDALTGTPRWSRTLAGYISANLAASAGAVYAVAGNTTLVALAPADGSTLWSTTLQGNDRFASNLVLAGGVLYGMTTDFGGIAYLVAFDARTGTPLLRLDDTLAGSFGQLAVAGGHVYLSLGGALRVYGLR